MDLTTSIRPGKITWQEAIDRAENGNDVTEVQELIADLPEQELTYQQLQKATDKTQILVLIAQASHRSFLNMKVAKLSLGWKPLTARQWTEMTSSKKWFFQRFYVRLKLLFTGHGWYVFKNNVFLPPKFCERITLWKAIAPEQLKHRFASLATSFKGLPSVTAPKTTTNIVHPVDLMEIFSGYDLDKIAQHKQRLNHPLQDGTYPIEQAQSQEVVDKMIAYGADLSLISQKGNTLSDELRHRGFHVDRPIDSLHIALLLKDMEAVQRLVQDPQKREQRNKKGKLPIETAHHLCYGSPELLEILIDAGTDCRPIFSHLFDALKLKAQEKARPYTSLHQLIDYADYTQVGELLKDHTKINEKDTKGSTPLHRLIQTHDYVHQDQIDTLINQLIDHGADLNATDAESCTPLDCVQKIYQHQPWVLRLNPHYHELKGLPPHIKADALPKTADEARTHGDFYAPGIDGRSLFDYYLALPKEVQQLFDTGTHGDPQQLLAVFNGKNEQQLETLLIKYPKLANVLIPPQYHWRQFSTLVESANSLQLWKVVEQGSFFGPHVAYRCQESARGRMKERVDKLTFHPFPLVATIKSVEKAPECREQLLQLIKRLAGENKFLSQRDHQGQTALFYTKDQEILQILLSAGADINAADKEGNTLLHDAVQSANKDHIHFLLQQGADKTRLNHQLQQPYDLATDQDLQSILSCNQTTHSLDQLPPTYPTQEKGKPLLYQAIDTSDPAKIKQVMQLQPPASLLPLHYAWTQIPYDREHLLKTLIEAGADLTATDEEGNTPFLLYLEGLSRTLVPLFLQKGAPLYQANKWGMTPLDILGLEYFNYLEPNRKLPNDFRPLELLLPLASKSPFVEAITSLSQERLLELRALNPLTMDGLSTIFEKKIEYGEINQIQEALQLIDHIHHLLSKGANPKLTNSGLGGSALDFATKYRKDLGDALYLAIVHAAHYS